MNAPCFNPRRSLPILSGLAKTLLSLALTIHLSAADPIRHTTLAQIDALLAEKGGRTPAQRKMNSQLVYLARQKARGRALDAVPNLRPDVAVNAADQVQVDVSATLSPDLRDFVTNSGGRILSDVPAFKALRAVLPAAMLEALAARADVQFVEPAVEATTDFGSHLSEGVRTHQADSARSVLGVDGTGIKIGVLSDGVDSLSDSQTSGNINALATVISGQAGSGDEGTAMMELIQDILPGAQLIFATAFGGSASFANNILALQAAGCSVIVDDVGYADESPFQDMVIAQAVQTVSNLGVMYFVSARNAGNKNDGTSGTWEGDFADGGSLTIGGKTGRVHDFGGGVLFNTVTAGGSQYRVDLFWADPRGASGNDYDLFVTDESGNVLRSSTNLQTGTQNPYESVSTLNVGERIVILQEPGAAARFLHLDTGRGRLSINTEGRTRGHHACAAANAFGVAATDVTNSPAGPFTGGATNPVETFSSDGPRRYFFEANGTPLTPGNFSSSGGLVLNKPDITAADGATTSVTGFSSFYGTSASAPHAAAIAAMIRNYKPSLTPAQVRTLLTSTAIDIEASGQDRDSGAGIVMAQPALQATTPPDELTIATSGLDVSGVQGGPFSPLSGTYTLKNTGSNPVNWTAAQTQNWNTLSASSGTLAAGESVDVTCSIVPATAASLAIGSYIDTVTIANTGTGFSRQLSVNLAITPNTAAIPVITSNPTANGALGAPFSYQITATNSPTSFAASPLPAGLSVNAGTGLISGTPTAGGTTEVTLSASNAFGTGTATLTLTLGPVPAITSSPTATGVQGSPFAYQISASNGPITGYTATPLPAGLTLNPTTGLISGTPTVPGTTSVTLSATNTYGAGSASLSLVVLPIPTITSPITALATQGMPFTYQIVATDGPILNYAAAPLPAGLAIDSGTGLISGIPTAAGTTAVTLSATNANGTGTAPLSLVVDLPPEIVVEQPAGSGLTDGVSMVNFGNAAIGSPFAPRGFTIRNSGLGSLRGLAFDPPDGSNPGDFIVTGPVSTTVAPNGSTTFTVTFNPLPGPFGTRSAVIHFRSNDADESPFDIALVGEAKDIAATAVIGQTTFTGQQISTDASVTAGPTGSAVSPSGRFALCDQTVRRVLLWDAVPSGNGAPATVVVGKTSLTDTSAGTSQILTGVCDGVAFSPDGKLLVSDSGNHRVLIWNTIPDADGAPANYVIGQTDFTTSTSGLSNAKFNYPAGILVTPDGKLLVADNGNHRVLIFDQIPTSNGAAADLVIGQSVFTTNGTGKSATQMNQPWGLSMAPAPDGRLLVADMGNNRILVFNTVPTASGQAADALIGQTQFGVSAGGPSRTTLAGPNGAAVALDGRVAISDYGNNRVLLFPTLDGALWGAPAAEVLGQPDFVTWTGAAHGVSAASLLKPYPPIFTPDGRLMVPGRYMRRALVFGTPAPAPIVEQPPGNVLQSNASSVSFGEVILDASSSTRTFTVRNAGGETLTGLAVSKDGASASEFAVNTAGMALSLPPGAATTFDVILAPGESGARNAALHISSNVAAGPITIAITGTGSTPAAGFNAWAASSGLSGPAAVPTAAPRADGTQNLLKYAFNLDAASPGPRVMGPGADKGLPSIQLQATDGALVLRFEYLRRVGSGLIYAPAKSANLAKDSWVPLTSSPQVSAVTAGWERVVYEEPVATSPCFGRLEVTLPQ